MRDRIGQSNEDNRLTEYRRQVRLENLVGSLKVFCGFLGLAVLFMLSLKAILSGTEGGLFDGGMLAVVTRFGKFGFFLACLLGLFPLWRDYSDKNGKECLRRKEMLAQIEADPNWWRKQDEEQRRRDEARLQWKKDQEELETRLASMGIRSDPDYWKKVLQRSSESLATLTRQVRDYKSPPESPEH